MLALLSKTKCIFVRVHQGRPLQSAKDRDLKVEEVSHVEDTKEKTIVAEEIISADTLKSN